MNSTPKTKKEGSLSKLSACKHDWYVYGDLLEKGDSKIFFPNKRECKKCKKQGRLEDADFTNIDQKL